LHENKNLPAGLYIPKQHAMKEIDEINQIIRDIYEELRTESGQLHESYDGVVKGENCR